MHQVSVHKIQLITTLALATFSGVSGAFAQAQSLLTTNQVVISRVENITPNSILISGINFEKFKVAPTVSLSGAGTAIAVLPSTYNTQKKDITALLPESVATIPGSYRLMVSFGTGTAGTDVFEFTVGAVGPKGEKGDRGEVGAKGDKGDTGPQGPKGDKGDTGAQGLQGVKGDKGDTGETGVRGPQGEKGDTGAQGPQGPRGDTGLQGPKGDQGEQGLTGPVGPRGQSGNFPVFKNENDAVAAGLKVGDIWVQDPSGQMFQIVK